MYGIYANIGGILMVYVTIYGSTMDPSWGIRLPPKETWAHFCRSAISVHVSGW